MAHPLLMPKNAAQFFITGPQGQLDCLVLTPPTDAIVGVAIVFHPNPTEGGSYTNKVVQTIAKALNQKNYICYCPNLRGVGLSEGEHDYGIAEVDDAESVYNYVKSKHPNLPVVLSGFSFGSSIASKLAARVEYDKLILVGVAIRRFAAEILDVSKTVIIHGENDEVTDFPDVLRWAEPHSQPVICFPNTGHFFHGKLMILQNVINNLQL